MGIFERMGDHRDDRSLTEQMNDLGVEVLPMSALDEGKPKIGAMMDAMREEAAEKAKGKETTEGKDVGAPGVGQYHDIESMSDDEVRELIDAEGLRGRISVKVVRNVPREKLEQMCLAKELASKMAKEFGLSPAAVNSLRKFYRLRAEDLGHRKSPKKSRFEQKESKDVSNENSIDAQMRSAEQVNGESFEAAMDKVKKLTEELYGKPEQGQVDVQETPLVADIPVQLESQEIPLYSIHGEDEAKVFAQAIIGLAKTLNAMGEREVSVFVNVYKVEGESE